MPARQPISPGLNRIRRIVPPSSVDSTHVRTPLLPLVLSPGFEPGLDSSLDCCLYRLGYESMCGYHPCEVAISAQSTIDPATRAGS